MKNLYYLTLLIALVCFGKVNATTYYFSTTDGDDSRSSTDAQSSSTPWKTLDKLNSFAASLKAGDFVLFKKGDVFYGSITPAKSGASGSPITYGAYGSGANPVISGFTNVTSWNSLGGNVWESASAVTTLATANVVVVNNVLTGMGRWPNTGYKTVSSHSGTTAMTDGSLSGSWTGAEVVIKKARWIIDRNTITSQSGGTINYTSGSSYGAVDGYGYFIQNSAATLDAQNEWYFDKSTKKLRIYSTSNPGTVQVSSIDNLVSFANRSYITFDGLTVTGANSKAFYGGNSNTLIIQNCTISFSQEGFYGDQFGGSSPNVKIQNNTISDINNNGIRTTGEFSAPYIGNNILRNIGEIAGAGGNGDGMYQGMNIILSTGAVIEANQLINIGYIGIGFSGNNVVVRKNFLNTFCNVKDDGGGIYTGQPYTGQIVEDNVVINGIGNGEGTNPVVLRPYGIYLDGATANTIVRRNSVANIGYAGIFVNKDDVNCQILNNTVYNCVYQMFDVNTGSAAISRMTGNIFFSKAASQMCLEFSGYSSYGTSVFDSNYYARPVDDNMTISVDHPNTTNYNLSGWQTFSGKETHSKKSPKTTTNVGDLRFEYNETASSKTVNLGATYMDAKGQNYSGSITLAPYTSAVLIFGSGTVANQPPVANAGTDQNITLPVSTASLNGSGTDPDGTISSYGWTKISGPSSYSFTSPTQGATTVNNLTAGIYQFVLTVTDNAGAKDADTVSVTVTTATNIPPVANAGTDQNITLPVNTATLSGSGNDPDGSISSYSWTKLSGPLSYSFSNPTQGSTTVSNLTVGLYQFVLTVTDNSGVKDADTVSVTVNPAANLSPTANAGLDQNLTLPVNGLTLIGSGTDPDGTISSYSWTKVSGPSTYNIALPGSATTSISGLVAGVYTFELKVTDNGGATATDDVIVTVNAAPNQPPTADAGSDISITLPNNTTPLSGNGNDADGSISSYQWTKVSGPTTYSIGTPTRANATANNLVQGVYLFELKVTDDGGAIAKDTVQVTVNPPSQAPNQSPIVNAGQDITITLPSNATLNGSGNDPDGLVASWQWTKITGPSQFNMVSPNQSNTTVNNMVSGVYQFELAVTDNQGATATDTVQVTVLAANQPPTAIAGADMNITLPQSGVTANGSGTDADGFITAYQWTKVSGPDQYTISAPTEAQTGITNLVEGVYKFELMVTDDQGATDADTLTVVVTSVPNQSPLADAGTDINITLPTNTVTFSGSGNDPDGSITAYQWRKISGPNQYSIASATSAQTAVNNLVQGTYRFELKVTDDKSATGRDTVVVIVNAAPNQPPTANAGPDFAITLPTNSATLNGSGKDADGNINSYKWTKISGPGTGSVSSSTRARANANSLVQGTYQFELMVVDDDGASARDTMTLTVLAGNKAPTANAGININMTLPTNSTTLNGSGNDSDGSIAAYQWTKVSGPDQYTIGTPDQGKTAISNLVKGVYQFSLMVFDNQGATGTATVTVTVNAANQPPTAIAGDDISITLPTSSVTFNGSGVDVDGTISSYRWTKVSGPTQYAIVNAGQAQTAVNSLVQGVYKFELMVTDDQGATGKDTLTVVVTAVANKSPLANAGSNITITLPTNSVTANGSGSDPDGSVSAYQWRRVSGPTQYNIVSSTKAQTSISNLVKGTYQFELKVTDNQSATGRDTLTVTVNSAPNKTPKAKVGSDISLTLPTNTTTLTGSASDSDGTIASYRWTKISGPSQYSITSASNAKATANNLVAGVYQFEFKATDNNGATATAMLQVTVHAAAAIRNTPPVAHAGNDINITLPANSVTLNGSGTDADGTITNYLWTKIAGPTQFTIASPSTGKTDVSNLQQGVYQFELEVTDNQGAATTDTVMVSVNAPAHSSNKPPTVNAGQDITLTMPVNSAVLSGKATDSDGSIASYLWTEVSGPSQLTAPNLKLAQVTVSDLGVGEYQFELKVTDNLGAIAKDTVKVTVLAKSKASAKVYPNPASNTVNIQMVAGTPSNYTTIRIYDGKGNMVYQENFMRDQQTMTKQINVSKLISGVYYVELNIDPNKIMTLMFVKQ